MPRTKLYVPAGSDAGGSWDAQWVALGESPTYSSSYEEEVLADSPVFYWRFEETTGSTAVDGTNNGNDGTIHADTTLGVSGALDNAFGFDPSSGNPQVVSAVTTDYTAACTLEAWVWIDPTPVDDHGHILTKNQYYSSSHSEFPIGLRYELASSQLQFSLSQGNDFSSDLLLTASPSQSAWHHVVATYTANGSCGLYVDKTLVDSGTIGFTISSNSRAWIVGAAHEGGGGVGESRFRGRIDEVALYSSALSDTRIQAHYDAAA